MRPRRMELIVDVCWVVAAVWYVYTASGYPSAARLIPLATGIAALGVGTFQLIGYFVPGLRALTHGRDLVGVATPRESAALTAVEGTPEQPMAAQQDTAHEERRQWYAIFWAAGLLVGIYLLGFVITIPLYFLAYFLLQKPHRWKLAIASAVLMSVLAYVVFEQLLSIPLYNGIILNLFQVQL